MPDVIHVVALFLQYLVIYVPWKIFQLMSRFTLVFVFACGGKDVCNWVDLWLTAELYAMWQQLNNVIRVYQAVGCGVTPVLCSKDTELCSFPRLCPTNSELFCECCLEKEIAIFCKVFFFSWLDTGMFLLCVSRCCMIFWFFFLVCSAVHLYK